MLDVGLTPRSPFAALLREPLPDGPVPAGVVLREATPPAMVALAVAPGREAALRDAVSSTLGLTLPGAGSAAVSAQLTLVWTQPGQWLALGEAGLGARLAGALDGIGRVIDVSGGRSVIVVSGPKARQAVQKLLPIDLDPSAFAVGSAATTVGAYLTIQVWRPAPDELALAVGRSFAVSLWRALAHAGEAFGVAWQPAP